MQIYRCIINILQLYKYFFLSLNKKLIIMKNLILFLFIVLTIRLFSQSASDVFVKNEIVWLGIDLSNSKYIGFTGTTTPSEIINQYFVQWNTLIISEPEKYNIKKFFWKKGVIYDIDYMIKKNMTTKLDNYNTFSSYSLPDNKLDSIVAEYQPNNTSGIGLAFIVESFNKITETASIYVTFIDLATKKVLFKEKMYGKASGFGLRNHWSGAFYNILKSIYISSYSYWRSKYYGK